MQKILWLVVVVLAVVCFMSIRGCVRANQDKNGLEAMLKADQDTIRYYRDKAGREHAERLLIAGSMPDIAALKKNLVDSVSKALGTKKGNIETITAVGVTSGNTVRPRIDTVVIDSTRVLTLNYSDEWIDINGTLGEPPELSYKTYDSLVISTYKKKTGLFKKAVYINGYSLNHHSHITGITGVKVAEQKARRIGIGPYVGYGWDGVQLRPSMGICLQYALIRL